MPTTAQAEPKPQKQNELYGELALFVIFLILPLNQSARPHPKPTKELIFPFQSTYAFRVPSC
jgi:hypothetical protein